MKHYVLTGATLHNICQHEDFRFEVSVGLNAITGRNGDGKSNLLRALAYGLTGMVDGTWGSQQDLQKDGSMDPGYVAVDFTDGENSYVVRRFSTSGTKFQDSLECLKDGEWTTIAVRRQTVNRKMEEFFGIPITLMFQIMWGRQGELDHLLTAPAAYVNSFLSAVFDTRRLETLRNVLKNALDTVAALPSDSMEIAKSRREELEALESEESLRTSLKDIEVSLKDKTALVTALETTLGDRPREDKLRVDRDNAELAVSQAEQRIIQLEERVREIPQRPNLDEQSLLDYRQTCRQNIDDFRNRLSELQHKEAEATRTLGTIDTYVEHTNNSFNYVMDKIKNALTGMPETCELCGQQLDSHGKDMYVKRKVKMLTELDSVEEYRQKHTKTIEEHKALREVTEKTLSGIREEMTKVRKDIAEQEDADLMVTTLLEAWNKYNAYQPAVHDLAALRESLPRLRQAAAELSKVVPVTAEDVAQLMRLRAEVTELNNTKMEISNRLASVTQARELLTRMVEDAEKTAAQYQINAEVRRIFTEMRDIFSQRRAQTRYLRGKIEELNQRIAVYMDSAKMPFQLYLNETSHIFEYTTEGGFVHPASRLSGAQRNISAVVLQMSILDVVAPRMNLFLVDEPSEALDPDNKLIQAEMFAKLSTQMPDIDGTMLIVTRDEQLIDSCNNNIKVSK